MADSTCRGMCSALLLQLQLARQGILSMLHLYRAASQGLLTGVALADDAVVHALCGLAAARVLMVILMLDMERYVL